MKKNFFLICFLISVTIEAQSVSNFTIVTTPPSCPTCCDGTATLGILNGSCGALSVLWSDTAGIVGNSQQINNCCAGMSYTATVASNNCGTEIDFCNFQPMTTSINNFSDRDRVEIYPNPTSEILNIEFSNSEETEISVVDVFGNKIKKQKVKDKKEVVDISGIEDGVYFVAVKNLEQQTVSIKKIIIQH